MAENDDVAQTEDEAIRRGYERIDASILEHLDPQFLARRRYVAAPSRTAIGALSPIVVLITLRPSAIAMVTATARIATSRGTNDASFVILKARKQSSATTDPSDALQHIVTLVEASAGLKDETQRKVLLRSVVVVAQKGLGEAPDGMAECAPNVLTFPTR